MNSFGRAFRFHILGESHGRGVGVVLDGVPAGTPLVAERIQAALDRRRPGQSQYTTPRREPDRFEILSGEYEGKATGAPLTLWIANQDQRSRDYSQTRHLPRPGHADWVAHERFAGHHDHRGGGHFSGRLTAALVAAGAVARELLGEITIAAHLHQVGELSGPRLAYDCATIAQRVDANPFKTAHEDQVEAFAALIDAARKDRDSVGGVVEWLAEGVPLGLGEPWADPVESLLAHLFFAIPAVKGVSFGAGFGAATMRGSEHNDPYGVDADGTLRPQSNYAGGILGGLSTGQALTGHVAIKPTSSIFQPQATVNLETGAAATLELKGRHDPLIAIRAVPVIEAAVAVVLADLLLLRHGLR